MGLTTVWIAFFGTSTWLGIDIGFWVSMVICVLVVIGMNLIFWGLKPVGGTKGN